MSDVKITVVKSVGYGYVLQHNQQVGFKGFDSPSKMFGWYRLKRDAQKAADELTKCYNK